MSDTKVSPFPVPDSTAKSLRRSLRSRIRGGIVLGAIAAFAGVTPFAYLYVLWSSTALLPSLAHHGIPSPPSSRLHYAALVYFAVETIFGLVYHGLAISVQRKRPGAAAPKDSKRIRDVVKSVFESNMGDATGSVSSGASSRRGSVAELPALRQGGKTMSIDSGYNTDLVDNDVRSTLSCPSSLSEQAEAPTTYNFLNLQADDPRAIDFRETARHWFHGAPFSSLTRQHLLHWMSSSLYGVPYEEIVEERETREVDVLSVPREDDIGRDKLETVERSVDLWEARSGTKLPERSLQDDVGVIRLTLDPVRVLSRPLALYCLIWVAQQIYRYKLRNWGFEEQVYGGLAYFVRTPKGWSADRSSEEGKRPLIFLHGLGIGPVQYAPVLNRFAQDEAYKDRPIAILVQPHLSMSIFNPRYLSPPGADESSASLVAMSKARGFDKSGVTVLSHSNGTIVHGWLLKAAPELVERSCLVDPVCFALWEPALPYNFLYAAAKSPMQLLMRYFVARELGVANTLQRNFDWISSLLRPAEIPSVGDASKASIFLSERDAIVDTPRISAYLSAEGLDENSGLKIFAKQKHGESMMGHGHSFKTVMSWVRDE